MPEVLKTSFRDRGFKIFHDGRKEQKKDTAYAIYQPRAIVFHHDLKHEEELKNVW